MTWLTKRQNPNYQNYMYLTKYQNQQEKKEEGNPKKKKKKKAQPINKAIVVTTKKKKAIVQIARSVKLFVAKKEVQLCDKSLTKYPLISYTYMPYQSIKN